MKESEGSKGVLLTFSLLVARRREEEVVDLESTGQLRVEARQERHQSLLSRSLTHTLSAAFRLSRSPETEEQGRA